VHEQWLTVMNYCNQCGAPVELRIPPGDSLPRHVCQRCATVHYQNPKLVIGCIAEWQGDILLCRRAIEPRYGLWTLPAGFMENGESTTQAALRETLEEACARIEIDDLFSLVNVPYINQVHLFYRGRLLDTNFAAGVESLETVLFSEADIPWQELAFRTVALSLKAYFSDRRAARFAFHEYDLRPPTGY
jgi:ADP-ribose pyrophosphatase YjhB (NUDIX family)